MIEFNGKISNCLEHIHEKCHIFKLCKVTMEHTSNCIMHKYAKMDFEVVQSCANIVDLETWFKMSICSQKTAWTQTRTKPNKFAA